MSPTTSPADAVDRGSSLLSTSFGVVVFLVFMLFSVQLLLGLYARTIVSNAAYDGARVVAVGGTDDPVGARARGEARVRQMLGRMGERATIDWDETDPTSVVVRVRVDVPRMRFPGFSGPLTTDHVDRTARVRVEQVR